MNFGGGVWCLLTLVVCSAGQNWRWPEDAKSLRIDTKVHFTDGDQKNKDREGHVHADEIPFKQPTDTDGFYNRPPGAGRYPVRVEDSRAPYRVDPQSVYPIHKHKHRTQDPDFDGTLDSLRFCKCLSSPECSPHPDSKHACGDNKFLCCYKQPNKGQQHNIDVFDEIDDERPMLFPGREHMGGPFPPPPGNDMMGVLAPGHEHDFALLGNAEVLVGPGGPTGQVGPPHREQPARAGAYPPRNPGVLVGPDGPRRVIGPAPVNVQDTLIEPIRDASAQRGVLVGPGGPTGLIGPYGRPLQFGAGGSNNMIAPARGGQRGVLAGSGGPTGIIGPYGRQSGPGILVGPGGPTGIIGPRRGLLVGPGGPTGQIGPRRYFGN